MLELIGKRKFKPFECVGTKKESLIAFYLSWKKNEELFSVKLPSKHKNLEKEAKKILNSWNNQHNLPKEFEKILKEYFDKF